MYSNSTSDLSGTLDRMNPLMKFNFPWFKVPVPFRPLKLHLAIFSLPKTALRAKAVVNSRKLATVLPGLFRSISSAAVTIGDPGAGTHELSQLSGTGSGGLEEDLGWLALDTLEGGEIAGRVMPGLDCTAL